MKNSLSSRHDSAGQSVSKRDSDYFRRYPGRHYRVRNSVPYEMVGWGPQDIREWPHMLVKYESGKLFRQPLRGKVLPPNNESFLASLWEYGEKVSGGQRGSRDQEWHLPEPLHVKLIKDANLFPKEGK